MTSQVRGWTAWTAVRLAVMTGLCAFVLLIGSKNALAHPGHGHKVMGEIVAIDGNQVTIKTTDGKERKFELVAATTFLRGKQKGAKDDLKVGVRLVVDVGDGKEPLKAKSVQYAAPKAS
jgi:hypothetical protein